MVAREEDKLSAQVAVLGSLLIDDRLVGLWSGSARRTSLPPSAAWCSRPSERCLPRASPPMR